jgi:hypothetical protein
MNLPFPQPLVLPTPCRHFSPRMRAPYWRLFPYRKFRASSSVNSSKLFSSSQWRRFKWRSRLLGLPPTIPAAFASHRSIPFSASGISINVKFHSSVKDSRAGPRKIITGSTAKYSRLVALGILCREPVRSGWRANMALRMPPSPRCRLSGTQVACFTVLGRNTSPLTRGSRHG